MRGVILPSASISIASDSSSKLTMLASGHSFLKLLDAGAIDTSTA
jgi:hypothetical protein